MKPTLYLLRHTEAHPGFPDDARELTEKGRRDAARMGQWARDVDLIEGPLTCLQSGLLRARQTAELFLEAAGHEPESQVEPSLAPEADPRGLPARLRIKQTSTLLVGHLPNLAYLAGLLLGGAAGLEMKLPKGGLLCLDLPESGAKQWRLRGFLSPKWLQR